MLSHKTKFSLKIWWHFVLLSGIVLLKKKKKTPKNIKTLTKARAMMLLIFIYLCPFPSINVTDKGCLIATVTLQVSFKIIGKIWLKEDWTTWSPKCLSDRLLYYLPWSSSSKGTDLKLSWSKVTLLLFLRWRVNVMKIFFYKPPQIQSQL